MCKSVYRISHDVRLFVCKSASELDPWYIIVILLSFGFSESWLSHNLYWFRQYLWIDLANVWFPNLNFWYKCKWTFVLSPCALCSWVPGIPPIFTINVLPKIVIYDYLIKCIWAILEPACKIGNSPTIFKVKSSQKLWRPNAWSLFFSVHLMNSELFKL